jgi:hypothetical protein
MDFMTILIVAGIFVVLVVFTADVTTGKALDTFGAGFVPYRGPGWPRGVQEGEPVAWDWSAMADRDVPAIDREPVPGTPAEIFELDASAPTQAEVTALDDRHLGPGTSIRD